MTMLLLLFILVGFIASYFVNVMAYHPRLWRIKRR